MTTHETITRLRKLERAATKGEWRSYDNYILSDEADGERGEMVAECFANNPMWGDNSNDTYLIAAARNALPGLLDALEEAVEALKEYEGRKLAYEVCGEFIQRDVAHESLARIEKLMELKP